MSAKALLFNLAVRLTGGITAPLIVGMVELITDMIATVIDVVGPDIAVGALARLDANMWAVPMTALESSCCPTTA